MQRMQKALFWTIMLSETTHIFCCVLPVLVSIASLMTGMGLMSVLPTGVLDFHEIMHHYEQPLILTSGVILALGWGLTYISYRLDCRSTGCGHGPCASKKRKSSWVLMGATFLFIFNTIIYFTLHTG